MTPTENHSENLSPDAMDDQEETVRRILELFDEKGHTMAHRLTVCTTLLAYVYLTQIKGERGTMEFAAMIGSVVYDAIPLLEMIGVDSLKRTAGK